MEEKLSAGIFANGVYHRGGFAGADRERGGKGVRGPFDGVQPGFVQTQPVANAAPFAAFGFIFKADDRTVPFLRIIGKVGKGKSQMCGYLPGYIQPSLIFIGGMDIGIIKQPLYFVAFRFKPFDNTGGANSAANVKDYFDFRASKVSIT